MRRNWGEGDAGSKAYPLSLKRYHLWQEKILLGSLGQGARAETMIPVLSAPEDSALLFFSLSLSHAHKHPWFSFSPLLRTGRVLKECLLSLSQA